MENKVMTSIKLQKTLHQRLQERIIADGYGMRGKSRWINEAIASFLELQDYPTLVDIAEDMGQLNEMVSIRVPEDTIVKIERAVVHVRKQYPTLEGVKSNLIRASIIQRLLGNTTTVTVVNSN